MKKLLFSFIVWCFYTKIFGQSILLQPGGAYPHTFKSNIPYWGDISTTQPNAEQVYYVSAPSTGTTNLGTPIGSLYGTPTSFSMNGSTNLSLRTVGLDRLFINNQGKVGINTITPATQLEVNGFTKLGSDAPKIKVKKITGITPSTQGGRSTYLYGLLMEKVIAIYAKVSIPPYSMFPGYKFFPNNEFYTYIDNNQLWIETMPGNSADILNKTVTFFIIYEE